MRNVALLLLTPPPSAPSSFGLSRLVARSVKAACKEDRPIAEFDTSCFSGTYVTGEKIGDEYFAALHAARNDDAQHGEGKGGMGKGGNEGCEAIVNDARV